MNNKAFMRRAQKLVAKAVQAEAEITCRIRKSEEYLRFEIIHFDSRYSSTGDKYENRSITVTSKNGGRNFHTAENFIDRLIKDNALISKSEEMSW